MVQLVKSDHVNLKNMLSIILLFSGAIAARIYYRRKVVQIKHTIKTDTIPSHMVFDKTDELMEDLDNAVASVDEIVEEFTSIEQFVDTYIEPQESVALASNNEVMARNR